MTFTQTRGPTPAYPAPGEVALEAAVTLDRATAMIAASWAMAEAFTARNYWPVTAAVLLAEPNEDGHIFWPRVPAPADVTVERLKGREWITDSESWWVVAGGGYLEASTPGARYRITQTGTLTPAAPGAHVVEAVRCLALYQLVHSAARREFAMVQAGDSTLKREALGGLFAMSGAGAMLAGEVQW